MNSGEVNILLVEDDYLDTMNVERELKKLVLRILYMKHVTAARP
ncbi:hypothetical protein GCM10028895_42630 [Pontibacter rugosus]